MGVFKSFCILFFIFIMLVIGYFGIINFLTILSNSPLLNKVFLVGFLFILFIFIGIIIVKKFLTD